MKLLNPTLLICLVLWCMLAGDSLAGFKFSKPVDYGGTDVVVQWTPEWPEIKKTKPVKFWLNSARIDDDAKGMKQIIERVRQMPRGSSLVWGPNADWMIDGPSTKSTAPQAFPELWKELEQVAAERGVATTWYGPDSTHFVSIKSAIRMDPPTDGEKEILHVGWRNYQSKTTPHDEVIYMVNGRSVGAGDRGLDVVLDRVRMLSIGSRLSYYKYAGTDAGKWSTKESRETAKKLEMADPVPFTQRREELDRIVAERELEVTRPRKYFSVRLPDDFLIDDRYPAGYFSTLLRFSKIVPEGQERSPAALTLSWKWPNARQTVSMFGLIRPSSTASAEYLVDGETVGKGRAGFLAAIEKIKNLNPGDVLRIDPICIRTKGPFNCVLMVAGHRHFETTGLEPFRTMIDIVAQVVEDRQLRVELIPDEAKPNRDCHPK